MEKEEGFLSDLGRCQLLMGQSSPYLYPALGTDASSATKRVAHRLPWKHNAGDVLPDGWHLGQLNSGNI